MFARFLRLGPAIDWRSVVPILACTALAAALPVGVPLLFGRIIDLAVRGAGLVELLPPSGSPLIVANVSW